MTKRAHFEDTVEDLDITVPYFSDDDDAQHDIRAAEYLAPELTLLDIAQVEDIWLQILELVDLSANMLQCKHWELHDPERKFKNTESHKYFLLTTIVATDSSVPLKRTCNDLYISHGTARELTLRTMMENLITDFQLSTQSVILLDVKQWYIVAFPEKTTKMSTKQEFTSTYTVKSVKDDPKKFYDDLKNSLI